MLEIDSLLAFVAHVEGSEAHRPGAVMGLDLRAHTEQVLSIASPGWIFLGCQVEDRALLHILAMKGLVFPEIEGLPFRPYRSSLYTIDELLEGWVRADPSSFHRDTLDGHIYRHFSASRVKEGPVPLLEALSQRLHDHAIDDALYDLLNPPGPRQRVVSIMGGHAMARTDEAWRNVARVTWRLARKGLLVSSGGGPGAMEAANLGAWMSAHEAEALEMAMDGMAVAPTYRDPDWLGTAWDVRERWRGGPVNLGVPTWFYGHEPSNVFATHIAKYFSNSLREDNLLAVAKEGVIYTPGSAGTIQEVFMDATQNHYGTFRVVSPMVFMGVDFWRTVRPVYPLVQSLAERLQYAGMLAISDDVDEIVDFVISHPPEVWQAATRPG